MRSRRPWTSLSLVLGAVLLLAAIAVGQRLGDRVLKNATEERGQGSNLLVTPLPVGSADATVARNWKREQVVSVATDPAFPDPRVTPKPTPTPRPTAEPTLAPLPPPPTDAPQVDQAAPTAPAYTSPPLPIPIASHQPDDRETDPPDAGGFPQGIPPVTPTP